jgi:hypothetical protein
MGGGTGAFQAKTIIPGTLLDILDLGYRENPAIFTSKVSLAIPTTSVVYSQSFMLKRGVTFGWEVRFHGTVVTVTCELEQANQPPATEGSQDDAFVIPVGKGTTNGLFPSGIIVATDTKYITAYAPVATVLARLKFTGTGSNNADCVCNVARVYEIKNT